MANNTARLLYDERDSPPTLSARINRRKQRARNTDKGPSLWDRVRSKREELHNLAQYERDLPGRATQVVRSHFEQVRKEAKAARGKEGSQDLSVNVPDDAAPDSTETQPPKKTSFQEDRKLNLRRAEYRPPPARNPSPWPSSFDTDSLQVEDVRLNYPVSVK